MKRGVLALTVMMLFFGLGTTAAMAANEPMIGVITKNKIKVLDENGEKQGVIELKSKTTVTSTLRRSFDLDPERYDFVEIDSTNAGGEFVLYRNNVLTIADQTGVDIATQENVFKKEKKAILAVGDIDDEYAGKEIIVCSYRTVRPRMKVYSYSSEGGIEHIRTFKPFGEKTNSARGCGDLAIGDTDNDGSNEIVTRKYGKDYGTTRIKVFDSEGSVEQKWDASFYAGNDRYGDQQIFVYDYANDGMNDIVIESFNYILAYTVNGNEINEFYNEDVHLNTRYARYLQFADIDNDDEMEFLKIGKGRKGPVSIINNFENPSENEIVEFTSHPNTTNKRNRRLIVGPFVVNE